MLTPRSIAAWLLLLFLCASYRNIPFEHSDGVIPPGDTVFTCSANYAWVTKNGKWCLVDKRGKEMLPRRFDTLEDDPRCECKFFAREQGRVTVCYIAGDAWCSPKSYDSAWTVDSEFFEYQTFVMLHGRYGVLDKKGTELCPPQYDTIIKNEFDCWSGILLVKQSGKWGLRSVGGRELVPVKFDSLDYDPYVDCRTLLVRMNDSLAFIDSKGRVQSFPPGADTTGLSARPRWEFASPR